MIFKTLEKLVVLEENYNIMRNECLHLPKKFIQNNQREQGEWVDSNNLLKVVKKYETDHGWLKSWQDDGNTWISWPIIYNGIPIPNNCKYCPKTLELLSNIKGIRVAAFNKLLPMTRLDIHTDDNTGLTSNSVAYNLGLDVPEDCHLYLRETKIAIKNGKSITFDSTFPHYADNNSEKDRYILYMDVGITDEEMALL
jgi:hypothetical protein